VFSDEVASVFVLPNEIPTVSAGIGISNEIPPGFIVFQRTSGQFQLVLFSASG
jgi:hypothetical protein